MIDSPLTTEIPVAISITENIIEVFHQINNILPEDQRVISVSFETPVRESLILMEKNHFSQLPVLAGNQVLGMFSYRAYALNIVNFNMPNVDLGNLPTGDFIENVNFLHILQDFTSAIDHLESTDVVFVGQIDDLQGVITPIDIVKYLYKATITFVLLGEIEKVIRRIIQSCSTDIELVEMVRVSLTQHYQEENLPNTVDEMEFNDYIQVIGHGDNWRRFESIFGKGDWQRKKTRTKLEEIRDLRNDAFHFRREIEQEDISQLIKHRDWIKNATIAYQAKFEGNVP